MNKNNKYPTEPLKCWKKAKELRLKYYRQYMMAKEFKGIRWVGSSWTFDAIPAGLGKDVFCMTGEPYSASCAFDEMLSKKFLETTHLFGFPKDLCSYMRNYLGSVMNDEFAFGGAFPKPDFAWTQSICNTHAKWYQIACEIEGNIPLYVIDIGAGPYPPFEEKLYNHRIRYVADQMLDGIEWLEKVTKRKFQDELFIDAVWTDINSTHTWAKICMLNRSIPAPLDEKTMFSLYVFGTLQKSNKEFADFYNELYEEVKYRVEQSIAACPNEIKRVITDSQPPWGFLKMYRLMEQWGAVSIGSLYTFALTGAWTYDKESHDFLPRPIPKDKPKTREEACIMLADWHLSKPIFQQFYHPEYKILLIDAIAKRWKVDGIILHFNRGCEGHSIGIGECRLGLLKRGNRVMVYEGNMGDRSEYDASSVINRLTVFLNSLGLNKM